MFPKGVSGASQNKRNDFLHSTLNSSRFDWNFQKQFAEACRKAVPEKVKVKASEESIDPPVKKKKSVKEVKKVRKQPKKQLKKQSQDQDHSNK